MRLDGQINSSNLIKGSIYSGQVGMFQRFSLSFASRHEFYAFSTMGCATTVLTSKEWSVTQDIKMEIYRRDLSFSHPLCGYDFIVSVVCDDLWGRKVKNRRDKR